MTIVSPSFSFLNIILSMVCCGFWPLQHAHYIHGTALWVGVAAAWQLVVLTQLPCCLTQKPSPCAAFDQQPAALRGGGQQHAPHAAPLCCLHPISGVEDTTCPLPLAFPSLQPCLACLCLVSITHYPTTIVPPPCVQTCVPADSRNSAFIYIAPAFLLCLIPCLPVSVACMVAPLCSYPAYLCYCYPALAAAGCCAKSATLLRNFARRFAAFALFALWRAFARTCARRMAVCLVTLCRARRALPRAGARMRRRASGRRDGKNEKWRDGK